MNYDLFRTLWHEALETANLVNLPFQPVETVELDGMSRTHEIAVALSGAQPASPFYVTATLSWRWDAALSARSATTEEDLLVDILGQDGYYLVTERPWLRVDVTLNATVPLDSPLPMPGADAWRRWTAEVAARLSPLLPIDCAEAEYPVEDGYRSRVLSARDEPEARLRCDPDGGLYLTGVYLPAWQGIDLPRQWDNSDREPDDWPDDDLADFAARVRQALQEWEECLVHLHPEAG
jgi:hypothetical protein